MKRKGNIPVLKENIKNGVEFLSFPMLEDTGVVAHMVSTKIGGVSTIPHLASMNLSYERGDEKEKVDENFRRIAQVMNRTVEDFIFSDQIHDTCVRKVTKEEMGCGILKPKTYQGVDGLITNIPGVVLATFYADCVPLFFVDPIQRVIGLSHSGWRGTVGKIGLKTVLAMEKEFGSRPENIIAAIGPSICQSCYEVGEEVAQAFRDAFLAEKETSLLYPKADGKYQLDLWEANRIVMEEAGIISEHINITDICTCCNPDYLFSHRATRGQRGNIGAFLSLN